MNGISEGHPYPRPAQHPAAGGQERPVLPSGTFRRTSRLAMLPLRHAARTATAASHLSRMATDQVAARTAEQLFSTLGELKGGAAKLGQAMSVYEAAMPEQPPLLTGRRCGSWPTRPRRCRPGWPAGSSTPT